MKVNVFAVDKYLFTSSLCIYIGTKDKPLFDHEYYIIKKDENNKVNKIGKYIAVWNEVDRFRIRDTNFISIVENENKYWIFPCNGAVSLFPVWSCKYNHKKAYNIAKGIFTASKL